MASIRGQKINLLIYDPNLHKLEEIFTDREASLASLSWLISNPRETQDIRSRKRFLKFKSRCAKDIYKNDDESLNAEEDSDTESQHSTNNEIDI